MKEGEKQIPAKRNMNRSDEMKQDFRFSGIAGGIMGIDSFLFITMGYPTQYVQKYTFLDNLVSAMADLGIRCTVCYPVSITHAVIRKEKMPPKRWVKTSTDGNTIEVYSPRIITLSNVNVPIIGKMLEIFNYRVFEHAVKRTVAKHHLRFDVAYGHFITPSALAAVSVAKKNRCVSCLAYGENSSYTIDGLGMKYIRRGLKGLTAVVSVSTENKKYLIENKIVEPGIIKVFPNGINSRIFYPRSKSAMRKKYNYPEDAFIVAFVGYFSEIKGSKRLSEALQRFDDVYSIFIGSGQEVPDCERILFQGSLVHNEIAERLSAADVFVLPTIAEGCCNAIIEAMGCGLPVISSNRPFNDDILDDECSIRIDTTSIDEITDAIRLLKNNVELRQKMSMAALGKANNLSIEKRAIGIKKWIEECSISGASD